MNIIHLASGDLWAGAEVQLFHMASAMDKNEAISLQVVLLNHGALADKLKARGVSVSVLDENQHSVLEIIIKLAEMAKQFQVDIIHSHRQKENLIGALVAWRLGVISIRTSHGDVELSEQGKHLKRRFVGWIDRLVGNYLQARIIAVSDELRQKMATRFASKKIITIYNSIDPEYVVEQARSGGQTPVDPNAINLGFVGRFVAVKRVDLLYQIARSLLAKSADKDIHFYFLGDGPLYCDITRKVSEDRLSERVHLEGFVANSAAYLRDFDYLLFASEHEGLPMTLLEAMCLKTPVISTPLPSIEDVLDGNRCGYFPGSDNPEVVAEYIANILANEEEALQKAELAHQILLTDYSIKSNLEKYLVLYRGLLE